MVDMKYWVMFSWFFCAVIPAVAQNNVMSGIVLDSATRLPVVGASVSLSITNGTVTDKQGRFSIQASQQANLTVKHISYVTEKMLLRKTDNNQLTIYLAPRYHQLNEIVIAGNGRAIMEKAIKKIPDNYGINPATFWGFKNVYNIAGDTIYFYKDKALVQVKQFGYPLPHQQQQVKVVHNNPIFLESSTSKTSTEYTVNGGYHAVMDIVYDRPDFLQLNQLSKYNFYDEGCVKHNNRVTRKIRFESTRKKGFEGTILMDSLTYAFVNIDAISYHNSGLVLGLLPPSVKKINAVYNLNNHQWQLAFSREQMEYSNIKGLELYEFLAIHQDSLPSNDFAYTEAMQNTDENRKVGKFTDEAVYQLKQQQLSVINTTNTLTEIAAPAIDTTTNERTRSKRKISDYLSSKKVQFGVGISTNAQLLQFNHVLQPAAYNFYLTSYFALKKNTFFNFALGYNFGLGGVASNSTTLGLEKRFQINSSNKKPISLNPYVAYTGSFLAIKNEPKSHLINWQPGIRCMFERSRKKSIIIGVGYNIARVVSSMYSIPNQGFECSIATLIH